VHVSIVNAHAHQVVRLDCALKSLDAKKVSGRVLTSKELDAHNTFREPERVRPVTFVDASLQNGRLTADIPPHSVVVLQLAN
jgi:alpha-N-arabinofuranosidase